MCHRYYRFDEATKLTACLAWGIHPHTQEKHCIDVANCNICLKCTHISIQISELIKLTKFEFYVLSTAKVILGTDYQHLSLVLVEPTDSGDSL